MTTTSKTSSLPAARPTYAVQTTHSLQATPGAGSKAGGTFIRNDPARQPVRRAGARPGEAPRGEPAPAAPSHGAAVNPPMAYSTAADWRKAADDSVPQQVFALVLAGRLSAARTLMRAYAMSPDAKWGRFGLDEALRQSDAQPREVAKFRAFLDESRGSRSGEGPPARGDVREPDPMTPTPVATVVSLPAAFDAPKAVGTTVPAQPAATKPAATQPAATQPAAALATAGQPTAAMSRQAVATVVPAATTPVASDVKASRSLPSNPHPNPKPPASELRAGAGHSRRPEPREERTTVNRAVAEPARVRVPSAADMPDDESAPSLLYRARRHLVDPVLTFLEPGVTASLRGLARTIDVLFYSWVPGRKDTAPKRLWVMGPGLRRARAGRPR